MASDDQDRSLESLLCSLPLREPSLNLDVRLNDVFTADRSAHRFRRAAIAAGIVLAIGIGVRVSLPKKSPPTAGVVASAAHPIQIERDTSTVYDDGVVATTNDAAYQQFRRRTVREIWYVDPKNHSSLQVVIPTEQVLVQKVDAY